MCGFGQPSECDGSFSGRFEAKAGSVAFSYKGTLNPKPQTLNPKPYKPQTQNLMCGFGQPSECDGSFSGRFEAEAGSIAFSYKGTLNPKPQTLNPKPWVLPIVFCRVFEASRIAGLRFGLRVWAQGLGIFGFSA